MAFVPAENVAFVELFFTYDGEAVENTLYFQGTDTSDPELLASLGGIVKDWWVEQQSGAIVNNVTLREVQVSDLSSATGPQVSVTTDLPHNGAVNLEGMPANVSPCISFRTGLRGRSTRGRNYICGIPEDKVVQNNIVGSWADGVVSNYDLLRTTAQTAGWTQVIVSRYEGYTIVSGKKKPTPRASAVVSTVTNCLFTDLVVDSQRGRLPNH